MYELPQCTRWKVHLVHCGSKFFFSLSLSSFSDVCVCVVYLVDCGSAAVGVEAQQYKSFYTVPFYLFIFLLS